MDEKFDEQPLEAESSTQNATSFGMDLITADIFAGHMLPHASSESD